MLMNSENSKTSDPCRLMLNLREKVNLKGKNEYVALSNPSINCTGKDILKIQKQEI